MSITDTYVVGIPRSLAKHGKPREWVNWSRGCLSACGGTSPRKSGPRSGRLHSSLRIREEFTMAPLFGTGLASASGNACCWRIKVSWSQPLYGLFPHLVLCTRTFGCQSEPRSKFASLSQSKNAKTGVLCRPQDSPIGNPQSAIGNSSATAHCSLPTVHCLLFTLQCSLPHSSTPSPLP
jgi:hypothetical protein